MLGHSKVVAQMDTQKHTHTHAHSMKTLPSRIRGRQ